MNKQYTNWIKKALLLLSFLSVFGIGLYRFCYYTEIPVVEHGPIFVYQKERDHDAIINLFERERFWLTVSDYDPVFMLKYMAPYKGLLHKDTLRVWVAREGDRFVGFTACYFEEPGIARILFLATEPEFRSKGYGKMLVKHALEQLHAMGAWKIKILTRNSNFPAQKIYPAVGFVETSRDQGDRGHVYYEYCFD
jgi:ribosomal protein S18 acetylase RimI-like enzyme